MALVQLNETMVISWKGGKETYNLLANTIVDVPEEVGAYIKDSPFYASKLVFFESGEKDKKKKKDKFLEEVVSDKNMDKFLEEAKVDNKESFKSSLIPSEETETDGLAQLMEKTLPSKVVKKPRAKKTTKKNKKIS